MTYQPSKIVGYKKAGVDGLSATNTLLFTTEAGDGNFIITEIRYVAKNVTGTIGVPPTTSIGTNGPAYDNIIGGQLNVAVATDITDDLYYMASLSSYPTIPASTGLYINIVTPATLFTTYELDVYILGFYEL